MLLSSAIRIESTLKLTYNVRSRQDTGISSPSLYPSLPLPLVFSADDPNGASTARPNSAAFAGNELKSCRGDMFARLPSQANWSPRVGLMQETGARRRHGGVSAAECGAKAIYNVLLPSVYRDYRYSDNVANAIVH